MSRVKVRMGVLVLAPLLVSVGGCHTLNKKFTENACNKPQPYQAQRSDPPLKIPSGLDTPDTAGALKLPALNEPAPPARTTHDPCLDYPPPYKVPKPPPAPQA